MTVEGADGAVRTRAYCVKAHLDGSPGADILSEARFYGELAPRIDVRMPRAYYTAVDDAAEQAMIIMDDVVAERRPLPERAHAVLARHHPRHPRSAGAPPRGDVGVRAARRPRLAGAECSRAWPTCSPLDSAPIAARRRPWARRRARAAVGRERGRGDATNGRSRDHVRHPRRPHSGNSYLDADGRACWLDWQIVQRGNWSTDVSYHLATVLDIEDAPRP